MEKIEYIGLESFACSAPKQFNELNEKEKEAFMDLLQETAGTMEGLCYSDHLLFIGKKK